MQLSKKQRARRRTRFVALLVKARLLGLPPYEMSLCSRYSKESIIQLEKWLAVIKNRQP